VVEDAGEERDGIVAERHWGTVGAVDQVDGK